MMHTSEKRIETWTLNRGHVKETTITKIAVRVPKGSVGPQGQRPGTFHGATNFVSNRLTTTAR